MTTEETPQEETQEESLEQETPEPAETPDADTELAPEAEGAPEPDAEGADEPADETTADAPVSDDAKPERSKHGTALTVGIAAVALVAGLVIGANVLGGNGPAPVGKASVTEAELDTAIATYTYDGNRHDLTVRDAIAMSTSLDAAKDSEGNYAVPTVDNIVNLARNSVLMEEAVKRNVTVSDEEIAKFAEQSVGSSNYAELATQYGLDEAAVKDMLKNSSTLSKLQKTVIEQEAGTEPEEPKAPKDVEKDGDKKSAEYADYIIKIVGTEWNAEKGTWVSENSMYAQILKDYKITADSASYNAAKKAYDTAYQVYTTAANTAWNSFIGNLFSNTSIQIRTVAS